MYALIPLLLAINLVAGQADVKEAAAAAQTYVQHTFDLDIDLATYAERPGVPNVTSHSKYELKCQNVQPVQFLCNMRQLSRVISGHVPTIPNDNESRVIVPFEISYENGIPSIKVERDVTCKDLSVIKKTVALVNPGISKPDGRNPPFTLTAKEKGVMGECYSNYDVTVGQKPDWEIDASPDLQVKDDEELVQIKLTRDVKSCSHTSQYFSAIRHIYAGATIKSASAKLFFGEKKPLKSSTSTVARVLMFGGLVPVTAVENNELVLKSAYHVTSRLVPVARPKSVDRYFDTKLFECIA